MPLVELRTHPCDRGGEGGLVHVRRQVKALAGVGRVSGAVGPAGLALAT